MSKNHSGLSWKLGAGIVGADIGTSVFYSTGILFPLVGYYAPLFILVVCLMMWAFKATYQEGLVQALHVKQSLLWILRLAVRGIDVGAGFTHSLRLNPSRRCRRSLAKWHSTITERAPISRDSGCGARSMQVFSPWPYEQRGSNEQPGGNCERSGGNPGMKGNRSSANLSGRGIELINASV